MKAIIALCLLGITCSAQNSVDSVESLNVSADYKHAVVLESHTGRVVRITDEEYNRLQKLRQAVSDAEMEIAKTHGVDLGSQICDMGCSWTRLPNSYEFLGQFLLVNVPRDSK